VRECQLPEPDLDNHVAVLALLRLSGGRDEKGKSLGGAMGIADRINLRQDRRQWLKASATLGAASVLPLGGAAQPLQEQPEGTMEPVPKPGATATTKTGKFFTPAQHAYVEELTETIIPADSHSGGAKAAKVADYIDQRLRESQDEEEK